MLKFLRLENQVMKDEGFRSQPYLDSVGVPTIGYGTTYLLGVPVTLELPPITQEVAKDVLRGDLYDALITAQKLFKRFDEMDGVRQEVIANMAYNLGLSRLGNFRKMIDAANTLDYERMAAEMKDSKWYQQVGYRSMRLVDEMRTGVV